MDPNLLRLLEEGNDEDEVAAVVRFGQTGVVPEGVRIVTRFGDIATVRLRRGAIPDVRASAEIVSMKPPTPLIPEPEIAPPVPPEDLPESFAWVDDRRPRSESATGRGVVVGVIDFGCDFAHPDFRHPDGRTRLLALWDQSARPASGASNRYGYGVIHNAEAINHALETDDPYAALGYHPAASDPEQEGAHGTHVAGIAAGNGRAGGPVGVAPEADLVFVQHSSRFIRKGMHRLGDSVTLLEAVDFIAQTAGERPWVINISMGSHGGQHDGSTLVEQGLDAALRVAPGRAASQSGGNYYQQRCHTSGRLRKGEERTFTWEIDEADVTANELEVWYSGRDIFVVELRSPDGALLGRAALGERIPLTLGGREIGNIYHRQYEPNNFDNHIDIFLYPGAPPGDWRVTLIAQDVVDGRFHAWIERDAICQGCQSRFPPEDAVPSTTTGAIANGFRTISVGAYDPHSPDQRVAPFSSCGPTRDDRLKPDLVAPGVNILAARSAPWDGHDETSLLTRMSGTSMASPHVAGALALMFEVAPRPLRIEETHNLLMASTRKVSASQEMASRIGSGYLNLDEAIKTVRQSVGTQLQQERPDEETHAHRGETEVVPQVLGQEDFEEESYYDPTVVTELDLPEAGEEEPISPESREPAQPGAPETEESTLTPGPREAIATLSERADRDSDLEYQMEGEEIDMDDFDIIREEMADMTDEENLPEEQRSHIGQGSMAEDVLASERTVSDIESSREWGLPFVEETDPVAEIGEALWKKVSTGVSVAIYDPDDAELKRRGVDWAKREDAIGLKTKKIEAAGLTFGKAIADSGNIVRTLTDLVAALKAAVDKVPAPSGTKGTTPSLIRILALFSHGWGTTLAIGGTINNKNAAKVIKGIAPVLTDDVKIVLYGCSVCRGVTEKQSWHTTTMEPGGADSLAASIRDALVDEGKSKASVWGHTEVGHTTTNWTLRAFYAADGKGAEGKAYAGQFVFDSEKTKALEDLERAIEAEGFRVEASKRADFESFVLEILKAHMYDAYGAANLKRDRSGNRVNNLTYNGVNLSEMAPIYPNEVAEIIRTYWRDVYWTEERKKSTAKDMIRRLKKLKVIEKTPVQTVEMAAPEVEEQAVAELAELEEQSAPSCYQILSGASGAFPAIGFELDLNYGASKVSPPLKQGDAGFDAAVYGLEGKNITTHRMSADGFRLEGDGNRIEIATKPFEMSAVGRAEMKKTVKDVLALASDLIDQCSKAKADTALGFPAEVGAPRYFKPSYLESVVKCVFPLALNPKKSYYGVGCAMGASPQATFTLPLARVDALVTLIKNSEGKKVAGRALSGPSGWRQGKRSKALYDAQEAVKKSRDHHIKAKTKLSNGDVVTQANFTPTLQGLLILMVSYLRTSELTYDHTPNGDWDYEEFAKAYLPLNVKNPFRLLFKDLTADEKRVFKELYDSPRVNLWRLAKDSATPTDKDNQLFPVRVEGHQKGWFSTAPTWDEFVEKTVTDTPFKRTESGPMKKGEDVGCEVLFAPLSRILPYESGSRRVTVEMRRLGFNWVLSHGFEKDGVKHPGWAEMTGMLFDMALELNKPAVTSVSPNKGPIKGGQAITIHGTGFLAGTTVKVGGMAATDVVVKDTNTLTAKTPSGTAGRSADVVVTTPAGTARLPGGYAYEAAASKPRGTGASPAELVDLADAAVGVGHVPRPPSTLLGEVLSGMGAVGPIVTNGHDLPSAAEIFDVFAYPGRDGLRQHLEQFLEVVAVPGSRIDHELRPGDLLLERALGEGDLAHLSMLTDGEVLHLRDLESAGLTPELGHSGLYAHVLELGAFPKNAEDRFARRLASESGRLGHDQMILRLRQDVAPFREEQELEEMYDPEDEWESDPAALETKDPFHIPTGLPFLLAGPIVRRVEPDAAWFWFACSEEIQGCSPQITVYDSKGQVDEVMTRRTAPKLPARLQVARLGERLWVAIVEARPESLPFQPDWFYGYDLAIQGPRSTISAAMSLGPEIAYEPFKLPTFVISSRNAQRLAQGSCRRPGGDGHDAYPAFDEWLKTPAVEAGIRYHPIADSSKRPSALILTGDQIYADDVAVPLFKAVQKLARDVCGYVESLPTGSGPPVLVDEYRVPPPQSPDRKKTRKWLTARGTSPIGFTTEDGEAHLLSFPEFAAMYLLTHNEQLCRQYGVERGTEANLSAFSAAIGASRRVLANTPTYMIFDDHEITDDWNFDDEWRKNTNASPMARRIIANGLAAYWAFQGWGNDPSQFGRAFVDAVTGHLDSMRTSGGWSQPDTKQQTFDRELLERHWSFVAPTSPPALCVDTRTRREDARPEGGVVRPILTGPRSWPYIKRLVPQLRRKEPLLLVLPTPLLPHRSSVFIQHRKYGTTPRRYEGDLEWYANYPAQRADLILFLRGLLEPEALVVFSGDVHHGSVIEGLYVEGASLQAVYSGRGTWAMPVAQVTSSPIKNIKTKAYERKWFGTDYGNVGESVISQFENQYKTLPNGATLAMRADAVKLDGDLGRETYIFENHLCVVDIPRGVSGADPSVKVLFTGVKNGRLATAKGSIRLHKDPTKFKPPIKAPSVLRPRVLYPGGIAPPDPKSRASRL